MPSMELLLLQYETLMSVDLGGPGMMTGQTGTEIGTTAGGIRATIREAIVATADRIEEMQGRIGQDHGQDTLTLSLLALLLLDLGVHVHNRIINLRKQVLLRFSPNSLRL